MNRRRFLKEAATGAAVVAGLEVVRQVVTPSVASADSTKPNLVSVAGKEQAGNPEYFTIQGAALSVDKSKLRVAGVHPDALESKSTIGHHFDTLIAEPGAFSMSFVDPDPVQGAIDKERIKSGVAVITGEVRRDLNFEGCEAELFEHGMTLLTTGYGTFTVLDGDEKPVMSLELPKVKKRGYVVYFRGRTDGAKDDDLNWSIAATKHKKPYTDAVILPTKQQFASENQYKQTLKAVFGETPQGTNCGNLKGCKEVISIVVDVTEKAFSGIRTTDGVNFQAIPNGTNIVG